MFQDTYIFALFGGYFIGYSKKYKFGTFLVLTTNAKYHP